MEAVVQGDLTAAVALQNKMGIGGTLVKVCCGGIAETRGEALENKAVDEVGSNVEEARRCRVREKGSDSDEVTGGTAATSRHGVDERGREATGVAQHNVYIRTPHQHARGCDDHDEYTSIVGGKLSWQLTTTSVGAKTVRTQRLAPLESSCA